MPAVADLKPLVDEPQTASQIGLSPYATQKFIADGLIAPVTRRGEPVTHKTGQRGRPAKVFKLTAKGKRQAQAA